MAERMRPRRHLVVFVRAPQLGAVKTRLASGIGRLAAWRFYRDTTRNLLRRVADCRWQTWLAVTPDRFARGTRFWPAPLKVFAQRPGDLGRRMAAPAALFPHASVVVIGSDLPAVERRHIAAAFAALGRRDVVFGPADDGGFWLVGYARQAATRFRARLLFSRVRWSSEYALADTTRNLAGRGAAYVAQLADVDTVADYERWLRRR
ncbi:MAG: DUF2064 domain-containing protein [Alphaproteobacteria bacterium]|nr:DUF2064 domain-containing protein [Alphaproteobacteria bacterium]